MNLVYRTAASLLCLPLLAVAACSASSDETGNTATGEDDLIVDAHAFVQRADGRFDVTCKDGRTEIRTAAEIAANKVCVPPPPPPPPPGPNGIFDENPCKGGTPLSTASVAPYFPAGGQVSAIVGDGTFHSRRRICNPVAGCTAWDEGTADLVWTNDGAPLSSGSFRAFVDGNGAAELRFAGSGGAGDRAPFECALDGSCHLGPGYLNNNTGIHTDTFRFSFTTKCLYWKATGSVATGNPSETAQSEVVFVGRIKKAP